MSKSIEVMSKTEAEKELQRFRKQYKNLVTAFDKDETVVRTRQAAQEADRVYAAALKALIIKHVTGKKGYSEALKDFGKYYDSNSDIGRRCEAGTLFHFEWFPEVEQLEIFIGEEQNFLESLLWQCEETLGLDPEDSEGLRARAMAA